jgi:isocitrate/isopropylmalate dehydrogenase
MSPSHIRSTERLFKIATIPGDGIGVDITDAAIQVLQKLSETLGHFVFEFDSIDWSSRTFKERGHYMPEDGLEYLKIDAIYFGAVGWPGMIQWFSSSRSFKDQDSSEG